MINYNIMRDEDLATSIQKNKNSDVCLNILIERHSGLCVEMINSYMSRNYNETLRSEMIKEKDYDIYTSALKFNPTKGAKFTTYLGNEIKWKCLNLYNKNKKNPTLNIEDNLINYFNFIHNEPNNENTEVFNNIISKAEKHPDKRVGQIFKLRYVVGKKNSVMPWKYISKSLNMSIQGCINIHDSALENFRKKIRKEINE